jgi:predicted lipoprotein with Yx(FWY)xxD motif
MKIYYKRLLILLVSIALVIITGCATASPLISTPAPTSVSVTVATQSPTVVPVPVETTPALTPSLNTVNIAPNLLFGNYLVDGRGRTLYYTLSDKPNYSNLPDEALSSWPVFYIGNILVPPSLNTAEFGTYTRDNNVKQTTFRGYPLYYFFQDLKAGDTLGHKLNGVWFIINPDSFQR